MGLDPVGSEFLCANVKIPPKLRSVRYSGGLQLEAVPLVR